MRTRAYLPRARWYRGLLDWLQWHGPLWLARRVPNWGIEWVETGGVYVSRIEAGA